jgi:AraC family transcriptional activator FtrA
MSMREARPTYRYQPTPRRITKDGYEEISPFEVGERSPGARHVGLTGARMVAVCSGAFILAEAGLLDGSTATTHWMDAAELAARFPKVRVQPDVLYVDDGDVLTSAGTAAGIDLCLHVVALDFGVDVANTLARRMVVTPHRQGGQAQYIEAPIRSVQGDDLLGPTLNWAIEHFDKPMNVTGLAHKAGLSSRHFSRLFKVREGTTPLQWLLHQRILLARRLLETTDAPVEVVASRAGFETAGSLRLHFQRLVRTTPSAYRRAFRELKAG